MPLKVTAFNGETSTIRGIYYTHPIKLEIGKNSHTTMVFCEIANAGKYYMIIPFGWWHEEYPIKNIAKLEKWSFKDQKCLSHVKDEGIADMFEWDENVAFEEEATNIGRIESTRMNTIQLERLPKPYWQYKEQFEDEKADVLAPSCPFDHAIEPKEGATPPRGPIYLMSAYQHEELNKYLEKMLAQRKIFHSKSPAGAPILFVPKPDGKLRLCVDYWQLNKLMILNKYLLLLMTELRESLAGATIFTKLDRKDGYYLICIRKEDEWKTAFRTRYGQSEYKVMPFGLVNVPATFQAMMNHILLEFLDHGVVVYLDNILIYSKNQKEHKVLVKKVLERLEQLDLAVSLKKSVFHTKPVEFLGYIIGTDGVTMSERKVESIVK